ncbi:MAG: aminoacyl-tRNA hydrolase [Cyclobacteriaceae bacterium]|jgi:ribosome-associated protein|nr:aminoacyl-tRNA hydrolase [Cyclobacteriaceae bacterium]
MSIRSADIERELVFTTSRSGGPGGQHINKVSSKVTLRWDIANSTILDTEQTEFLLNKLKSRLTSNGILILISQESRSQTANRESVVSKLDKLLQAAYKPVKARKRTKPTSSSIKKRLDSKKLQSEKKQSRRKW